MPSTFTLKSASTIAEMRSVATTAPAQMFAQSGIKFPIRYADYMQTDEFAIALRALIERARQLRVALMCAEAVPWRCHRSLIADALSVRGIAIEHIIVRRPGARKATRNNAQK